MRIHDPLWLVAVALLVILAVGLVFGALARWLLRGRAQLDTATTIVLAIAGSAVGLAIAGAIKTSARIRDPLAIVLALGMTIAVIAVYSVVAARFQSTVRIPIADLLRAGESDGVEFKSTARINLHTGQKDPKIELVIAKTVAALANADGGTLLIGVDDDGRVLGLTADLATLKTPDLDRYELWLRDLLTTALGMTAATAVGVDFADPAAETDPVVATDEIDGDQMVCRIQVPASAQPVYLLPTRNEPREFWVRMGNSSRRLPVDEAAGYIMHRWPLSVGASLAAQIRASVRFSAPD